MKESEKKMNRRRMLKISGAALMAGATIPVEADVFSGKKKGGRPFKIGINTSTISGYKLPVEQMIDLCAEAGFESIELWMSDVRVFMEKGGTPETLASRIKNSGLQLDNMIGFAPWITGAAGMDEMKREMELSARLGSKNMAATGMGLERFDPEAVPAYARSYRDLIEFGETLNVCPLLELWGQHVLHRLSDLVSIAVESQHPKASLLLDFYHLYRGGNSFDSLSILNGKSLPVFHLNDYPGTISRENLKDADRVLPGEGICPLSKVIPLLHRNGFQGTFSLELFNPLYWEKYTVRTLLNIARQKVEEAIPHPGNRTKA
jgi:sugar phosphate isomerase/epimerase